MFGRPRCREWTPLATQQLRLRSLIQIVGYNIRPPEMCSQQCSYYITLHHTTMSAPFYTSERIASPHPKWKEIDSEITQRMSSTNVVIRIWCHEYENTQDSIIQTWGIYFSGLRYIGANLSLNFTSDCFKSNTLVFQMHGGYFCSYKSLKLDVIPHENEIEHGSLSSDSSGKTNLSNKITLEAKFLQNQRALKESRSLSPSKSSSKSVNEYSKSHSPVEVGFKQHIPIKSSSLNINQRLKPELERRTNQIYEHSPETLEYSETSSPVNDLSLSKIDLSETAENYDLRSENDWVPKYRYLALNFLKSEIRPSYNVVKLQKLHLLQYSIKKRQEAMQDLKERIYKKSALRNVNENLTDQYEIKPKFKSRSQRNLFSDEELEKCTVQSEPSENGRVNKPNGPRLTLKLNDLLSIKSKPSPQQISEHIRLTKQLEILRFKRIILSDERDAKLANIRKLKEAYSKLCEENQDIGTELMQNYHALSRSQEALKEARECAIALREITERTQAWLSGRRSRLLKELHDLFYIEQNNHTWTIVGTPLPISSDDSAPCPPGDAVAAGLVAQCLALTAAILDMPLRYKITLMGSASKILDVTPDLPDPNIPLFARGGDVTLFRYGMFLLNKCVGQLLWARGHAVADMRPTLGNVKVLLTTNPRGSDRSKFDCPRAQSLRSLVASDRGKHCRQFNRFKESIDGQSPHSLMSLRHRHSRSVGSCQDEQELPAFDTSTTSIMGSEPNIYNTKLLTTASENLKPHNSDSEISKIGDKVVFTVGGDDVEVATQKLVKLSVNNENECPSCIDENVKRICSEINSFCSQNDVEKESLTGDLTQGTSDTIEKNIREFSEELSQYQMIDQNEEDLCHENQSKGKNSQDLYQNMVERRTIDNNTQDSSKEDQTIDKDISVEQTIDKNKAMGDMKNIDIIKRMESRPAVNCDCVEIESQDVCEVSCANLNKDVIVIQSAEARFEE